MTSAQPKHLMDLSVTNVPEATAEISVVDWKEQADIQLSRAKDNFACEEFEAALRDIDNALDLQPDHAEALLLRTETLRNIGGRLVEASLAAKHAWLVLELRSKHEQGLELLRDRCRTELAGLGESADGSLPKSCEEKFKRMGFSAPRDVFDGSRMVHLASHIAVQVSSCGKVECNGIYLPSERVCNGQPVYVSARGFQVSLELLPAKSSQELKLGWVLGKERVGFYGACGDASSQRPPKNGWRCFQSGLSPTPTCLMKSSFADALVAEGMHALEENDVTTSICALANALVQPRLVKDMRQRATVLSKLAKAYRIAGYVEEAHGSAAEAISLFPACVEAHEENSRSLMHLGNIEHASVALRRLLAVAPHCVYGLQLLRELASKTFLGQQWLNLLEPPLTTCTRIVNEDKRHKDIHAELKYIQSRKGPDVFENRVGEVHARWTLPQSITVSDITVKMTVQHVCIIVQDVTLYAESLEHMIKPSESCWTYDAPELLFVLCKGCADEYWVQLSRESRSKGG